MKRVADLLSPTLPPFSRSNRLLETFHSFNKFSGRIDRPNLGQSAFLRLDHVKRHSLSAPR